METMEEEDIMRFPNANVPDYNEVEEEPAFLKEVIDHSKRFGWFQNLLSISDSHIL